VGHWEWERGQFKLPTAEFARVRASVQAADLAVKEQVFELTQTVWKGLTPKEKRDRDAYTKAVDKFINDEHERNRNRNWGSKAPRISDEVLELVDYRLDIRYGNEKPRRVVRADMNFSNNRTLQFAGRSVSITFDREHSSVTYATPQDRRVIEEARNSGILSALMKDIEQMRWTRGTGGTITNDDEYAEEGRQENFVTDHNYVADGFGPIGAATAPFQTKPWKDPKGDTFHAQPASARGGAGRVQKGVPAGGQFASRWRSEDSISLRNR
tara:strand:- start:6662 stop:7468 length:807 start_codon:yes stop_codon:yes gene_type:complete